MGLELTTLPSTLLLLGEEVPFELELIVNVMDYVMWSWKPVNIKNEITKIHAH